MKAKFKLLGIILIVIILGIFTACGDDDPKQDNCSVCGKPVPCGTDHNKPTTPGTDPETDPCCTGNCSPCTCGNECTKDCCNTTSTIDGVHSHDFTKDYKLLGLDSGDDVITAMNTRCDKALEKFYPITSDPEWIHELNPAGGLYFNSAIVIGIPSTRMAFVRDSTGDGSLFICGKPDNSTYTITFNIAVIRSDGKGWVSGKDGILIGTNDLAYSRTYSNSNKIADRVSISTLTGGKITTLAELSGYEMYVIIRTVTGTSSYGDFNEHEQICKENVIKPQILTN